MRNTIHKYLLFIYSIVFSLISVNLNAQEIGSNSFNENWQFYKGDISLEDASQNNKINWRQIELPHDWSVEGPFSPKLASGTGFLTGGIGWYKKAFDIKNYNKDYQYAIYFDGIYKNSEIWINNHYLGKRPNGFIPIQYDLTPYLKESDNLITVKVDHSDYADSRYYTGSGIYRNSYLIVNEKHHFSKWGIFFTTPKINSKSAFAEVDIAFENHELISKEVVIKSTLKDSNGTVVVTAKKNLTSQPGVDNNTTLNFKVNQPKKWSVDSPYLYNLTVELWSDGKLLDQWNKKVGIRDFKFDANKGFFLNGESMLLKGVCIHHDAGALGAAVPKEVWVKRLQTLKELGCNAIRMSHYPHQEYMYDLCDEMGFLVQDEAFDEWEVGKNKWIEGWNVGTPGKDGYHTNFAEWSKKDLSDMVLRNRNHPSIFMWSIGNEIDYPNDPYSHPVLDEGKNPQIYGKGYQKDNQPASRLGELAKELVKTVKLVDKTRPVTAALAGVTMSNFTEYPSSLDIVGYNYQEYRYKEDHKKFPKRIIYGSENGDSLEAWRAVEENEFISSQFIWTAFDFLGEAYIWPARSSNAGVIDLAGKPKPEFYYRQSLWTNKPMVYIAVRANKNSLIETWIGEVGEKKTIICYTNAEEVELFLNGKSLGRKKGGYQKNKKIEWETLFEPGELLVKSYINNTKVGEYYLNTPNAVSQIMVKSDKNSFDSTQKEIIHLDLLLTDENGIKVVNDDYEIIIEVTSGGKLLGLESGDISNTESYQNNYRKTFQGKLRAYIITNGKKEDLKIKIKSGNLPEKEILIIPNLID